MSIIKTISDYEPEFTPVALDCVRHDGWTPEQQRLFLVALVALGTVDAAAQAVGMSRISAYNLKQRADAGSFAEEWDRALGLGRGMRLCHGTRHLRLTTIKMRLGGAFEFQTGPDTKHIMKVLRLPPPRRDAKVKPRAS